jgi:hypothetical protein
MKYRTAYRKNKPDPFSGIVDAAKSEQAKPRRLAVEKLQHVKLLELCGNSAPGEE